MYGRLNRPRDVAYASARCTGLVRRLPWSQILGFDGIEPRAYTLPAGVSEGAQNHGHSGYRRILEAWGAAKARSRPAAEVVERTQCPFRGLRTFFFTPSAGSLRLLPESRARRRTVLATPWSVWDDLGCYGYLLGEVYALRTTAGSARAAVRAPLISRDLAPKPEHPRSREIEGS